MKQQLLIITGLLCFSGSVLAQQPLQGNHRRLLNTQTQKVSIHKAVHDDMPTSQLTKDGVNYAKSTSATLGTSTYQLQTNSGIQNRISHNSDGTISATFTFSDDPGSTWPDRGTGYLYFDGSVWSASPTNRVESIRTGWPTVLTLGDNSEALISHNTASTSSYDIFFAKRPAKGTGAWTENATALANNAAPYGNLWPRTAVGGTNNQTIHMISISFPTDPLVSTTPAFYMGQQGAITYCRSTNGGTSWDMLHYIDPAHDSTQYYGFDGDAYSIHARGNTVAYVAGGFTNDVFIMKSTDNGTTWNKTIVMDFPVDLFQDQLIDTTGTNDGSLDLVIDTTGRVHVFFGNMNVLNDDSTDAQISYFPGTSGIWYWNETMGPNNPTIIADAEDIDASMTLDVTAFGTYQVALTSQPSAGVDATNGIHLTYSGIIENSDDGSGNQVRNIYYMKSVDGGNTWIQPVRVMSDDFTEQVYCSIARDVDPTCISMIYMSDIAVGHGVGATNPDAANNIGNSADMIYVCYELYSGVNEIMNLSDGVSLYPNPSFGETTINSVHPINRVEVINTTGSVVFSNCPNSENYQLNLTTLPSGIYMISMYIGSQKVVKRFVKL